MSESGQSRVPAVPRTFRLPVELDRRIGVRAELDFVGPLGRPNKTRVVVEALEAHLSAPEKLSRAGGGVDASLVVGPVQGASQAPVGPRAPETVDLAGWLSARLGLPASICRAYVDAGRVTVGGRPGAEVCRNVAGMWLVPLPVVGVELDGALVAGG